MPIRELSFVSQDPIVSVPYTRYRVGLNAASATLPCIMLFRAQNILRKSIASANVFIPKRG